MCSSFFSSEGSQPPTGAASINTNTTRQGVAAVAPRVIGPALDQTIASVHERFRFIEDGENFSLMTLA
jgi:hypothetical protein